MQTDPQISGQTNRHLDFAAHNLWHSGQAILLSQKVNNLAKCPYREVKRAKTQLLHSGLTLIGPVVSAHHLPIFCHR